MMELRSVLRFPGMRVAGLLGILPWVFSAPGAVQSHRDTPAAGPQIACHVNGNTAGEAVLLRNVHSSSVLHVATHGSDDQAPLVAVPLVPEHILSLRVAAIGRSPCSAPPRCALNIAHGILIV